MMRSGAAVAGIAWLAIAAQAQDAAPAAPRWSEPLEAARAHLEAGDYFDAVPLAQEAMQLMEQGGAPSEARIDAAHVAGMAAMSDARFSVAARAYAWALESVPPQIGDGVAKRINPDWAFVRTRAAFAIAAHAERSYEILDVLDAIPGPVPRTLCEPDWRQSASHYPGAERGQWRSGAVMLQYSFTPEGGVRDVEILAQAPDDGRFAAAALESAALWRVEPDSLDGCLDEPEIQTIMFVPS